MIVYGIEEDKSRRVASEIAHVRLDGVEERIRNAAKDVDPPIEFEVRLIRPRPGAGEGVVVVVVPQSHDWPHMVRGRYPIRYGTTTRYLSHTEVKSALTTASEPKLTVGILGPSGNAVTTLEATSQRPWPIDVERIVSNEVADALQTVTLYTRAHEVYWSSMGPFGSRPTKADHERAKQDFRDRLPRYAEELRSWLEQYAAAARARADAFNLTLELANAADGAHAEDVLVVLELPATLDIVEETPELPLPPERPQYSPPRPKARLDAFLRPSYLGVRPIDFSPPTSPATAAQLRRGWRARAGGRRLEASAGDVHAARSVALPEPPVVRAHGPGEHVVGWTAYTKSADQPTTGTLTLVVPADPPRSAFGRLAGITAYPEVPLVDDDGNVVHAVRSTDPPERPKRQEMDGETSADTAEQIFLALRDSRDEMVWQSLGLDPANDGPLDKTTPDDVRTADV